MYIILAYIYFIGDKRFKENIPKGVKRWLIEKIENAVGAAAMRKRNKMKAAVMI
jgi:hypothetical protein